MSLATERHYTPAEIAEMWSLSEDFVRRIFADRTDVLKFSHGLTRRRKYTTIRIPESTLVRVHQERTRRGVLAEIQGVRRAVKD